MGSQLYHNSQKAPNSAEWASERKIKGRATQIALARNADGRLELVYIGTVLNQLIHNSQTKAAE